MPCPYDPSLDPDPDKVSKSRRVAHDQYPMVWDLYLLALIHGMKPTPCTLSSTYRQDHHAAQ